MIRFARGFCIVAEELHFGRAAARLNVTQPALSHQIKMLEQDLGFSLLKRSPHQVALTDAGAVLARELGIALAHMERAVQEARDVARGDAGVLSIGYCELPDAGGMSATLRRFVARYPDVEVRLQTVSTDEQGAALAAGRIDIGFIHPPVDDRHLVLRPAGREDMVAALSVNHELAARPQLRLADLMREPIIFCSEQSAPFMHRAIMAACARAGFQPRLRAGENSWHSMVGQAIAGLGIALVPVSLAAGSSAKAVFKPILDLDLQLHTAIATAGQPQRPAVQRFLAMCPQAE
jgi:DNA-binding transcriptional LysR family regulator